MFLLWTAESPGQKRETSAKEHKISLELLCYHLMSETMFCTTLRIYFHYYFMRSKGLDASQVGPWIFTGVKGAGRRAQRCFPEKFQKEHQTLLDSDCSAGCSWILLQHICSEPNPPLAEAMGGNSCTVQVVREPDKSVSL